MGNFKKTISYLKRNGFAKTVYMVKQRLSENKLDEVYSETRKSELATPGELRRQSELTSGNKLKISILVPTYETPEDYLRILIDSILIQSYENFEICIADASISRSVSLVVTEYDDERIRYIKLDENKGISENTNAALLMATGDVVCAVDHDDFLEPDALYYIAKAFIDDDDVAMVYTDEDKYLDGRYIKPNRKPDFNYDLLLSNNYICHLFAVKTDIARQIGGYRREYDGAQDFDYILRCVKWCADNNELGYGRVKGLVRHISRVLYHWRIHEGSTAENPESKKYAYEAGRYAVSDHLESRGIKASVTHTGHLGFYRISYGECDKMGVCEAIPDGIEPVTKDAKELMSSYFARPEVHAVCARLINKKGIVLDACYEGMDYRDSGLMHRSHMVQDIDEPSLVCFKRDTKEGSLIVYDPQIIWRR